MGLDCSHDAFHGAYSAFNSLRQAVAHAVDGSYPPHFKRDDHGELLKHADGRLIYDESLDPNNFYTGEQYTAESHPGLFEFLRHSDCDGEISPEMCAKVADDLQPLVDKMPGESHGHIARAGGFGEALQNFIDGCRAAHAAGEPLIFD